MDLFELKKTKPRFHFTAMTAFLLAWQACGVDGQAQAQTLRFPPKKIPPQMSWTQRQTAPPLAQQPLPATAPLPFRALPTVSAPRAVQPPMKVALLTSSKMPARSAQPAPSAPAAMPWAWDYVSFKACFLSSGRKTRLTESEFKEIQERKGKVLPFLENYLKEHFRKPSADLLEAFAKVPREYFQYHYQNDRDFSKTSYEMPGRAYAIGYGSALSDYQGQAYMAQLAQVRPRDTVLEIGTGSGYNAALLSRMAKSVYSIEILKQLGESVVRIFKPLCYDNLYTRVGDGYYGWPEVKEGFDVIIVTCAAQFVPPPLLRQLKPHGRIIIPIGQPFRGHQALYVYSKDSQGKVHCRKDMGVFFVPMKGDIQKKAGESKEKQKLAKR
jgi:protein-L-isoaspartate(D-aspartate) O-methyltransferase